MKSIVITDELMTRLWAKIDVREPNECWPFTGAHSVGYGNIGLGGRKAGSARAHRIVAIAAHGQPEPGQQARHLCGRRDCCNPAHIAWGHQSDNERDKIGHGVSNRGERHGMSKLTADAVREVRHRWHRGTNQDDLAAEYGVSQQTISEIVTGRTWAWLTPEGGDA